MSHILIVDDEDSIRHTFSIFLERSGHTTSNAKSIEEAQERLENESFDLVISDIVLPGGSGTTLLDKVHTRQPLCPIVMITGQPTVDNAAESLRQGAFDYLLKPVRKNDLLRVAERALEHKALLDGKRLLEEENARYRMHLEELVQERTEQLSTANTRLRREIAERQQAEQDLRKHQERLAIAMDISGAAEFELFPLKNEVAVSERFAEITGIDFSSGASYYEAMDRWIACLPEDRHRLFHEMTDKLHSGEIDGLEESFPFQRPDGAWRYMREMVRTVEFTEDGRASRIVAVLMDITSQVRGRLLMEMQRDLGIALGTATSLGQAARITIEALKPYEALDIIFIYTFNDSEQTLDILDGVGLTSEQLDIMDRLPPDTPHFKMLLQGAPLYSRYEDLGELMFEKLLPEGLQAVGIIPMFYEASVVGAVVTSSRHFEHMPQETRYVLEAVASQVGGAFATIKAQEALKASEAKYRFLIDAIPHGLVEFDTEGRVLFCNHTISERHGLTPQEMIGDNIIHYFLNDTHRQAYLDLMQRSLRDRQPPTPFVFQIQHSAGHIADLQADWSYNFDENGVLRGFTAVVTDITDRTKAEEELRQAREELEHRVEERTRALHEASEHLRRLAIRQGDIIEEERRRIAREIHDELGQNLTALNMGLSVLVNVVGNENKQAQTRLEVLRDTMEQMIHSVQRICQELRPMQLDDLDLSAAIAWHVKDFERATGLRTILYMEPEELSAPPEISTAVYRLVQEALTNAARHARADTIHVELMHRNKELTVRVMDNGVGIPDEAIASRDSFGLLGMHERIHAVNGELTISSGHGRGTTVTARLPGRS